MDTTEAERILKLFADSLEQGKDFAVSEAPEVVQQLVLWTRVQYGVIIVVLLIFAAIGWRCMVACIKYAVKEEEKNGGSMSEWRGGQVVACIATVILLAVSLGVAIDSLQVWLAPKVYVLEYAADLLR
jgi:hypothetical protein